MNRITIFLFSAIVLLLGIFIFKKTSVKSKTETLREERSFIVEDADDIYKILVASRDGKPARLTRKGKDWYLEEGLLASPYVMEGILEVLTKARVQYVPDDKEVANKMAIMATKGIKVEAYNKSDEMLLSYYIGGVTQNEKGTYFYKEGADRSYVMEMSYGEVNIRQRFSLQYDDWKNRLIFNDRVDDITSVKVEYPRSPSHGFIIENKNGEFSINPASPDMPRIQRELKPDVFEKYLVMFKGVNFVEFNNRVTVKDSIMSHLPYLKSELVNRSGDTFTLSVWPKAMELMTPRQAHDFGDKINGYYAVNRNGDFGTVQQHILIGMVAGYSDFYK
jgi:hypothetical protein